MDRRASGQSLCRLWAIKPRQAQLKSNSAHGCPTASLHLGPRNHLELCSFRTPEHKSIGENYQSCVVLLSVKLLTKVWPFSKVFSHGFSPRTIVFAFVRKIQRNQSNQHSQLSDLIEALNSLRKRPKISQPLSEVSEILKQARNL